MFGRCMVRVLIVTLVCSIVLTFSLTRLIYWKIDINDVKSVNISRITIGTSMEEAKWQMFDANSFQLVNEIDQLAWKAKGINPLSNCAPWKLTLTYTMKNGKEKTRTYEGQEHTMRGEKYYSMLEEKVKELRESATEQS